MINVLLFKRVGTLQLSSYGITVITRYVCWGRIWLLTSIIWTVIRTLYIPSKPRFVDQYLHCSGIDFCLNAIFWMGRPFSFVILQSCSVPRETCFLLHCLSSGCVRFCTVRTIEQVILNLDFHGSLVNIIFRSWKSRFFCGHVFKTCHNTTIKVPRFSRAVHPTIFCIWRRLCCAVFRGSDHGKSIIYLILFLQYSCSSLPQLRFE